MSGIAPLLFRLTFLAVVLVFLPLRAVQAQSHDSRFNLPYQFGAEQTWNEVIRPAFREVMSREDRQLLETITITFPRSLEMLEAVADQQQCLFADEG